MAGVFRRPFRRVQRRRIVHGVAAVVSVQAPGLHRRRQPMAIRRVLRVRQTVAFVVGGIGRTAPGVLHRHRQPQPTRDPDTVRQDAAFVVGGKGRTVLVLPIARMLMERRGKILRERLARKPLTLTVPLPVVVGATPPPVKPFAPRKVTPVRSPVRIPVTGIPAAPVVGATPPPVNPATRQAPRLRPQPPRAPVFGVPAAPGVGSTPFPVGPSFRRVPSRPPTPRAPVFGFPAVPTVGFVPFTPRPVFRPAPTATLPHRAFVVPTAVPVGTVTVCTSGAWSSVITFVACDSYRLEIDGPALDIPKVSITMELEES